MARDDKGLTHRIRLLYQGRSRRAEAFRYALLIADVCVIAFFVVATMLPQTPWLLAVDFALALFLAADYGARFAIAGDRKRYLLHPVGIADLLVILSLVAAVFVENLGFLRVLRALRLMRSHHVLRDLRARFTFFKRNEDVIQSAVNLFVFVFVVAALVFVMQAPVNPAIESYTDALYFTVATLTTTGFGDITLKGDAGHLLAVLIMVVGVGLFLRLLQTIFRPAKVRQPCPECGLARHEADAIHCKHCGAVINIETEGEQV